MILSCLNRKEIQKQEKFWERVTKSYFNTFLETCDQRTNLPWNNYAENKVDDFISEEIIAPLKPKRAKIDQKSTIT